MLSKRELEPWTREAIPCAFKAALGRDDTQIRERMGQIAEMVAYRRSCECHSPPNGGAAAGLGHQQEFLAESFWVDCTALRVLAAFERAVLVTAIAAMHEWPELHVA